MLKKSIRRVTSRQYSPRRREQTAATADAATADAKFLNGTPEERRSSHHHKVSVGGSNPELCYQQQHHHHGHQQSVSDAASSCGSTPAASLTAAASSVTSVVRRHKTKGHNKAKDSSSASDGDQQAGEGGKKKNNFKEIIHTAWVHRGFSDDVTEVRTIQPGGDLLTDFQKDKFRYFFFHVLDLNADCVISAEDFQKLNERIRHYMDWSVNSIQYLAMKEVHETFLECFLKTAASFSKNDDGFDFWDPFKKLDTLYDKMDQVTLTDVLYDEEEAEAKTCVTIDEWIDVWGTLVGRAKKLDDFPMWLQYYPKILFDVINRAGTGAITKSELKYFYTAFMDVGKLGEESLDQITDNAFEALTSGGDIKLNYHIFKLSFLNFLLGKQPNGPGQYLFGTVRPQNATCMFPIDYSAMNATEEDLEPFMPNKLEEKGSRRSVLV